MNPAISRICRPFDTYFLLLVPRPQESTTRSLDVTLHDMDWTYTVARQRRQGGRRTLEEEHDHCDREWSRRCNTYIQTYWIGYNTLWNTQVGILLSPKSSMDPTISEKREPSRMAS
jgi:hypothetical protein